MRALRTLLIALPLMLLATSAVQATTVLQVDVGEAATLSDWVVEVRVVSVASVDLRSEGKGLFTDVTLAIRDVFKGENVPATYVMRLVGGEGKDGLALMIPGMPIFSAGERAVLFLEKTNIGHVPCGLGQGVWRIHQSNASQPWVEQSVYGLHMMSRDAAGNLKAVEPDLASSGMPLVRLLEEVYAALDQPAPTPPALAPVKTVAPKTAP